MTALQDCISSSSAVQERKIQRELSYWSVCQEWETEWDQNCEFLPSCTLSFLSPPSLFNKWFSPLNKPKSGLVWNVMSEWRQWVGLWWNIFSCPSLICSFFMLVVQKSHTLDVVYIGESAGFWSLGFSEVCYESKKRTGELLSVSPKL